MPSNSVTRVFISGENEGIGSYSKERNETHGKTIVITASFGSLGAATARAAPQLGAQVALID
jgi:hypothetical protein